MRFVIDDHDALEIHKLGYDALQHLAFTFLGIQLFPTPALQSRTGPAGDLELFPQLERMVIGDNDARLLQILQHILRHQLATGVVGVWIIGLQNAQTVLDGDARRDHQKALGETSC